MLLDSGFVLGSFFCGQAKVALLMPHSHMFPSLVVLHLFPLEEIMFCVTDTQQLKSTPETLHLNT